MKVGDLIKEREYPEVGFIVDLDMTDDTYGVLCPDGNVHRLNAKYIEKDCEVISESR